MDHSLPTSSADATPSSSMWAGLSIRQRIGLVIAAIAVVSGLGWGVSPMSTADVVPLQTEAPLTPQLRRELCDRLNGAGLTGYQQSGTSILVPRAEYEQYADLLPSVRPVNDWAAEWEQQNERLSPFSGSRALETNREIARAKLIAGMLRQLPDVAHADIVWDEDERPGWRQTAKTRATVYLEPQPDRVLTLDVIRAVRLAVAGSKKNLDPEDVLVMDLARQITYEGTLPRTPGDDLLPQLQSLAELYRRVIREQIRALSDANVSVDVDLPRFFACLSGEGEVSLPSGAADGRLSAIAPKLMRVDVTVGADSDLTAMEQENVRRSLQRRIIQVTGIGARDLEEQVIVRIERSDPGNPSLPRSSTLAAWLKLGGQEGRWNSWFGVLLATVFVLLVGGTLLRRWRRMSPHVQPTAIPALSVTLAHAHQSQGIGPFADLESLLLLDPQQIQQVYSRSSPSCWAIALRGASAQTGDQLAATLSPTAADELRDEIERLSPVTIREIQAAQQRILQSLDTLHAPAA